MRARDGLVLLNLYVCVLYDAAQEVIDPQSRRRDRERDTELRTDTHTDSHTEAHTAPQSDTQPRAAGGRTVTKGDRSFTKGAAWSVTEGRGTRATFFLFL